MTLSERARAALQAIEIPRARRSLGDLVENLSIDGKTAHVRMRLLPAYVSKSQLRSWVERALKALPEIEAVHVEFAQTPRQAPRVARPPQKLSFPQIAHIVAIFSGKGGVGKSTVGVNLAVALAQLGTRVGLFDADVHGPNIPTLLGLAEPPAVHAGKLIPICKYGVHAMSIGLLVGGGDPLIWRGPMISKAINELLESTAWPELDYLIVDMPPGTGDAQLGLAQDVELSGAIAVTTPQEVALSDGNVRLEMTLTTVGCPLYEQIQADCERAIKEHFGEDVTVEVDFVFDPPWSPEMMSEEIRAEMGFI
jgi:ATP-binding protein involved in chromosome partitioning